MWCELEGRRLPDPDSGLGERFAGEAHQRHVVDPDAVQGGGKGGPASAQLRPGGADQSPARPGSGASSTSASSAPEARSSRNRRDSPSASACACSGEAVSRSGISIRRSITFYLRRPVRQRLVHPHSQGRPPTRRCGRTGAGWGRVRKAGEHLGGFPPPSLVPIRSAAAGSPVSASTVMMFPAQPLQVEADGAGQVLHHPAWPPPGSRG